MEIKAYAKLNLMLNVIEKIEEDYHDIETIMVPLELHDIVNITIIPFSNEIQITCNNKEIPINYDSVMYKTIMLLKETFNISKGIHVHLNKNIPISSGLGGESADIAACIKGIINLCNIQATDTQLKDLAKSLGWDVPFCLFNRPAYIRHTAENIQFIQNYLNYHVLLVQPAYSIKTKEAFIKLSKLENYRHPQLQYFFCENKLIKTDNSFLDADKRTKSDYALIKKLVKHMGFTNISLSGTGSCFFLLTKDKTVLLEGKKILEKYFPYVRETKILLT